MVAKLTLPRNEKETSHPTLIESKEMFVLNLVFFFFLKCLEFGFFFFKVFTLSFF